MNLVLIPRWLLSLLVFATATAGAFAQRAEVASGSTAASAAAPDSRAVQSGNYVLKPNDDISVRVFRNSELDGPRRISKDGTIDFPLVGIVKVAGKTPYEAAAHLAALLDKDYLVRPQVFVTVIGVTRRYFNVIGQVTSPGTKDYPQDREVDILSAIAAAGGFTRLADQGSVIVRRQEGGKDQRYRVDVRKLTKDAEAKPFRILPNDTIVVDERFF